jgi:hypothetical protein
MPATATAVPATTRLSSLRSRHARVADDVRHREEVVERLRSEIDSASRPGVRPLTERRALTTAVHELLAARTRLAQVSRELRQAGA